MKSRSLVMHRSLPLCLLALFCFGGWPRPVLAQQSAQPHPGYNLYTLLGSTDTYLMDNNGNVVHTWVASSRPTFSVYLLENGDLLRIGVVQNSTFVGAGTGGGLVERLDANSSVVWSYTLSSDTEHRHHDIEPLPNGNVLMIAWEMITGAEAIAAGRDPLLLPDDELWPDKIVEVDPTTNQVVWEWRVWDHLVQDYDAAKPRYGTVADHPELIDLNFVRGAGSADWLHTNRVDYNAELDQIILSVHGFNEAWIIDHATTTAEAAGPAGDLVYRWGNPQAYDSGTADDQVFYGQHDAQWIEAGLAGTGNILVFNNGRGRPEGAYSSIEELTPPVDVNGNYTLDGAAYGPDAVTWNYTADPPTDLYSQNNSGAQRLGNGNTLICEGDDGDFIEVSPQGEVVWTYAAGGTVFDVHRYDTDDPGVQALLFGVCPVIPLGTCGSPGTSILMVKDYGAGGPSAKDKFVWKWLKGPAMDQADFGDPVNTTGYMLCLYTGSTPTAVMDASVAADGTCGSKPCWRAISTKGYKYSDKSMSADGISKVLLKGGDTGQSKAMVLGKDGSLPLPTLPLDPNADVIAQLSSSDPNSHCWEGTFPPAKVIKNTNELFKAKAP